MTQNLNSMITNPTVNGNGIPTPANDNFKPDDHEPPPAVPGRAHRGLWP